MVIGKSIGGGDQMQELDEEGKMEETIRGLADTRVTRVERRGEGKGEVRRRRA